VAQRIAQAVEILEDLLKLGMVHRAGFAVFQQVLLADIGDIGPILILGEEVVIGLLAPGAQILGDRFVPFLAVGEDGVDVEDDPRKSYSRWRTTSPIAKLAWLARGMSMRRPAVGE
jgi:hypothetical protein